VVANHDDEVNLHKTDCPFIRYIVLFYSMPHVSKRLLQKNIYTSIIEDVSFFLSRTKEKASVRRFLKEILTSTEELMIAKRLAVIYMLSEGYSPYRIYQDLKISPSTVERYENYLQKGRYKTLVQFITREKNSKKLPEWILLLIDLYRDRPRKIGKRYEWLKHF